MLSLHLRLPSYLLTHSTEQSTSWEADRFAPSQEIPSILWNPKFHYRIYKCPPPVPIPRQINSLHVLDPTSWRSILILSSHLRLGPPNGLFPLVLPTKTLYAPPLSPRCVTCPSYLILLDLITRVMFDECRSLSSSLCSFLHYPITSILLGSNILLSTLFSKHPQPTFFPQYERPRFTPMQHNRQHYSVFIYLLSKVFSLFFRFPTV
jgi:hypothetical protein